MSTTKIEKCDLFLKELIKCFYRGNLNYTLQEEDIKQMSWNNQELFVDATVNSAIVKKYPVNSKFVKLFFKKLIKYLEPIIDIHDDIYTHICLVMEQGSIADDFCYRHYIIGNDFSKILTMKETNSIVRNGTTGMRTWEAALIFADWALCNKEIFLNRNVLELGSGVGFTGVTIAKFCKINSIMLTDCHEEVLKTICTNIEINFPTTRKEQAANETIYKDKEVTLAVTMLDWNDIENSSHVYLPDILIGADIIYDPAIISPLCNTLKTFIDKNKSLEIYIVNIIRNQDTVEQFMKMLDILDLSCEIIEHNYNGFLDWDLHIQKYILKINRKFKS